MKPAGGFGESDKALRPENRGWQRSQKMLKSGPFHRRGERQKESRSGMGQTLVTAVRMIMMTLSVLVFRVVVRVGVSLQCRRAGACFTQQTRRDFSVPGRHDPCRGIDLAQADFDPLPRGIVDPVR